MPQVFQLLQSFSLVESLLSLVAFSVACVTAYLLIKHKSQAKLIPQIIEKAQTADQQALARDLMRVFPSQKATKLSKENIFELLKLELEQRTAFYRGRMRLFTIIILCATALLGINIAQQYFTDYRTSGDQSPIVKGDDAHIEYTNE